MTAGRDWPPLLSTAHALLYADISLSTLNRAVRSGALPVYGKTGGRGTRRFRREDIDAWLAGNLLGRAEVDVGKLDVLAKMKRSTPARSANSSTTSDALARIRAVAKGRAL